MAKNKTEIHVTTVFDGELDATDAVSYTHLLVKKKCYVMSDHQEMMKKKFHSDNFQLVELKN